MGEPRDFPSSTFIVGHGTSALLNGTCPVLRGGHSHFESDLLPQGRTIELSNPAGAHFSAPSIEQPGINILQKWKSYRHLPHTLDIFGDGSLLIVDAPGHLQGHINLLARTSEAEVYLGGDACHDRRLLTGEKKVGEWLDDQGHLCCIHMNRKSAEETIGRIKQLEEEGVEVIFTHDPEWEKANVNGARFFGS